MGEKPAIFTGDHTKADDFIEEVKAYFCVNQDVAGFNSPIKKVAFTLTLIKGDEVARWVKDMGTWIDGLDHIHQNFPIVWTQFLDEFETQFQDLNKQQRARIALEKCCMQWPHISQYISDFEKYARQAGYTQGDAETTDLFLKGLPTRVLADVLKPPYAQGYEDTKQKAVNATQSLILLDAIISSQRGSAPPQGSGNRGNLPPHFTTFARGNAPYRPFFQQNRGGGWNSNQRFGQGGGGGQGQQQPQYNSTNAPRWMNNQPVPMDINRSCALNNWRGRGCGGAARGNVANAQGSPRNSGNNACFQCGQQGHFARNCPQRQQRNNNYANLIDFNNDDQEYYDNYAPQQPVNPVDDIKAQLAHLSGDDKAKLAEEMGVDEDFPTA